MSSAAIHRPARPGARNAWCPGAGAARLRGLACLGLLAALGCGLAWLEAFNREDPIDATFRSTEGVPPRTMVIRVHLPQRREGKNWRIVLGREELEVDFLRNRVRAASEGSRELVLPATQGMYLVGEVGSRSCVLRPADLPLGHRLEGWVMWALFELNDPRRNSSPPPSFEEARRRLAAIVPAVDSFWGPPEPPPEPEEG